LSKEDQEGCVDVRDKKDVPSHGSIILRLVLPSFASSNCLENHRVNDVCECDPASQGSCLPFVLGGCIEPGFAILLSIFKNDI
jgi:hypothetical protein